MSQTSPTFEKPADQSASIAPAPDDLRQLRSMLEVLRATAILPNFNATTTNPDGGFAQTKQERYQLLIARLRGAVRDCIPHDAIVLVISKGDQQLLALGGRRAWHFPQTADGTYAGAYPPDSNAAIQQFEAVRSRGAQFLIIPGSSAWWLEYYGDFRRHLRERYLQIFNQECCIIFDLHNGSTALVPPAPSETSCSAALPDAPEDAVRIELADSLYARGRVNEARQVLGDGLARDPENARLMIQLIRLEIAAENFAGAESLMGRYVDAFSGDADLLYEAARLAWQQGQLDLVERRLATLLQRYPAESRGHSEMLRLHCSRLETEDDPAVQSRITRIRDFSLDPAHAQYLTLSDRLRAIESIAGRHATADALALLRDLGESLDFTHPALPEFIARLLGPVVAGPASIPVDDRRTLVAFLTHIGNGFAAARDAYRTQACYLLAQAAELPASAPSINLGMSALARGNVNQARAAFGRVHRLHGDETCRVLWPAINDRPWPHAPYPLEAEFEKLKPPGASWPRITVISPSYNQARYVEECVLSVVNQEYPNLEYIVVDGNSTDGAADILRRYTPRIDKLIIEPDRGQTHALNKGLAAATGDILLWINSDDMLGPGALFMAALTWLSTSADIIAGFCFEHADRRFGTINLPAASPETFNLDCLGNIFEFWMKGHFFYQPEVAISRRILQRAGAQLDEKLHYTMDYEFWMRCANAGASLAVVPWPIGFFRKHDQQKTANLDLTVIEQGAVRDRFIQPQPSESRRLEVHQRLARAFEVDRPRVHVVSTRAGKIFSPDTARELHHSLAADGIDAIFHDHAHDLPVSSNDVLIYLVHLFGESASLRKLRDSGFDGPAIGWFWDNHHHVFDNVKAAVDLDILIPGHAFAGSYLRSRRYISAPPVPLCVTQWTAAEAESFFNSFGSHPRCDDLYGGFVRYPFAHRRNRLIDSLLSQGMSGVFCMEESDLARYFGLSLSDRFRQWASHKVSLCLPLGGDLSQRLFDALLTGQIPVVAPDIHDLDAVLPPDLQAALPIIRLADYSPDAVREAHAAALRMFNSHGNDGVVRRHRYALENHMFHSRVRQLVATLRQEK